MTSDQTLALSCTFLVIMVRYHKVPTEGNAMVIDDKVSCLKCDNR